MNEYKAQKILANSMNQTTELIDKQTVEGNLQKTRWLAQSSHWYRMGWDFSTGHRDM